MTKVFNKRNAKRVTAILLAVVAVVSSIFIIPTASAAGKEVTVTFDYCYDTGGNIISFVKYTEHGGYTVGTVGEELCRMLMAKTHIALSRDTRSIQATP